MPLQPNLGKSGTRQYNRAIPQFWSDVTTASQVFHPTVVSLDGDVAVTRPFAPMLILTRHPLPVFESYNSFFQRVPVTTRLLNASPVTLDVQQLRLLGQFTVRLCRIIMNKPFVCALDDITYFFAPLGPATSNDAQPMPFISHRLSWDTIARCAAAWGMPLNTETPDDTEHDTRDAIVQDRAAEFTKRFEAAKLRRDLTPRSQIAGLSDESKAVSLLDRIKSNSQSFAGLRNDAQPIMEVSAVECHANYLSPTAPPQPPPSKSVIKYLIPELCTKLTIPASILRTALVLPSVLHKIDCLLLVKELNATSFNNALSDRLLDMAVTCPSACMEFDYERLELLGDAFLKYLTSVYVIASDMPKIERTMHVARQRLINNNALTQNALRIGLSMYIQSRPFVPKSWKPYNFEIRPSSSELLLDDASGLLEETDQVHWLADKTIADVAEAIIGAAYLTGGDEMAFNAAKSLGLTLPMINHWSDIQSKLSSFSDSNPRLPDFQKSATTFVESLLGSKLRRPEFLSQAFSGQDSVICNAVEFAGDAILEFFVVRHVFHHEIKLSSGGLSLLKAAMISNSTLAALCVSSGLSGTISCAPQDMASINAYSNKLKARLGAEYKQAEIEKRSVGQFWRDLEPPKLLVTLLKSTIGALYVSESPSLSGMETFFGKVFTPFYDKYITIKTLAHRPTVALVELLRGHGCHLFDIKKENTGRTTRCQVLVHNQILATVEDQTASYAVMGACRSALDTLETNPGILRSHCDCKARPRKKIKEDSFNQLLNLEDQ